MGKEPTEVWGRSIYMNVHNCNIDGHRLGRAKFYGDANQFIIRMCRYCEYIYKAHITIDHDNGHISVNVDRIISNSPMHRPSVDNTQ